MYKSSRNFHHENWPTPVFYFPIFLYYLYNSIKLRRLNYFTSVNPSLSSGGLCGFSKYKSFKGLDQKFYPKTIFFEKGKKIRSKEVCKKLKEHELKFPLILKPDQGERGFLVKKVETLHQVMEILSSFGGTIDFIIQDFVASPLELGVFLIKKKGMWEVTSVTSKEFLSVVGDGKSTVRDLVEVNKLNIKGLRLNFGKVLEKNEVLTLEPIGNHCRGTKFINSCDKIQEPLVENFSKVLENVKGINYCRLDLKTPSWEEFVKSNFKVLEINGVSAEPGHIYDSKVTLGKAYKDLFFHWKSMAEVAKEQFQLGVKPEDLMSTLKVVGKHLSQKRKVKNKEELEEAISLNEVGVFLKNSDSLDLVNPSKFLDSLSKVIDVSDPKLFDRAVRYEHYDRISLFYSDGSEIVLCRWRKGDEAEVHHHPGKSCWFKCLRGEIFEHRPKVNLDFKIYEGDLGYIDDSEGPHQIKNISNEDSVSLHLYRNK